MTARKALISTHVNWCNAFAKQMIGYVKNMGGFKDKAILEADVKSFFVRSVPRAFGNKIIMIPEEEALVNSCSVVDRHYTFTAKKEECSDEIDEYFDVVDKMMKDR